jgi:hypothetical protein
MDEKTRREPHGEDHPGSARGELKLPDKPENECRQEHDIGKR